MITLPSTLEFTTRDGETFVLRPGEVLVGADTTGTGHRWRLIDDQPWRRLYVELHLPSQPNNRYTFWSGSAKSGLEQED